MMSARFLSTEILHRLLRGLNPQIRLTLSVCLS